MILFKLENDGESWQVYNYSNAKMWRCLSIIGICELGLEAYTLIGEASFSTFEPQPNPARATWAPRFLRCVASVRGSRVMMFLCSRWLTPPKKINMSPSVP